MSYYLQGKYGKAFITIETLDSKTKQQIYKILNSDISSHTRIAIMPDSHAGAGGPIGLSMTVNDKISPDLVGSDIGCGVSLFPFYSNNIDLTNKANLKLLDKIIHNTVPSGKNLSKQELNSFVTREIDNILSKLSYYNDKNTDKEKLKKMCYSAMGTLGGGNHFIELYKDDSEENKYWISVHTGSRSFGGAIYNKYKRLAKNHEYYEFIKERQDIINSNKDNLTDDKISEELKKHKKLFEEKHSIDNGNESIRYLMGQNMVDYVFDSIVASAYAKLNRMRIISNILLEMFCDFGIKYDNIFESKDLIDKPHNYIELLHNFTLVLRKGAQSSDGKVIIPINMRDGMIIGRATNDTVQKIEWNNSAPHGAGRRLSRKEAFDQLSMDEFKKTMQQAGIYSTTVIEDTLDEAPDAYKDLEYIKEAISPYIVIEKILKPIYNFKGGKEMAPSDFKKNKK